MVRKRTILGSVLALGIVAALLSRRRSSASDDTVVPEPAYDFEESAN